MTVISGTRSLHRLIYASRVDVTEADLEHEVGDIIRASIRNNRDVSVTGLLLIHARWFVQALEGPAESVMTTYRRILDDRRHRDSKVLSAGPASAREFGDWNMCARGMSAADDAIADTLSARQAFDPPRLSGSAALRLLKTVRGIQDRDRVSALG